MIKIQDFFAGHPRLQEQFPGRVVQFAQLIGNLPEQDLQDLLVNAQIAQVLEEGGAHALPHGEMPGGLPGDNFVQLDFGGEADIEMEDPTAAGAREGMPAANDAPVLDEDEQEDDEELEEVGIFFLPLRSSVLNHVRLRRCLFVSCAIWWAVFGVVLMLKRKILQKMDHMKKLSWMAWTK